jgi:REP element-mobilizing transposase RayT
MAWTIIPSCRPLHTHQAAKKIFPNSRQKAHLGLPSSLPLLGAVGQALAQLANPLVQKGLRINAYVIKPTHLHAILFHADFQAKALEQVVTDFRKFTGRRLADFCAEHLPACFQTELREHAGGDCERRLWQPTRHPVQIETESFWQAKIDYLHHNPVRKGLVRAAEH